MIPRRQIQSITAVHGAVMLTLSRTQGYEERTQSQVKSRLSKAKSTSGKVKVNSRPNYGQSQKFWP